MSEERKPWMTPVIYNDDRFVERDNEDDRDDAEEEAAPYVQRVGRGNRDTVQSTDSDPINYGRGPHDEELGVDEEPEFSDALEELGVFGAIDDREGEQELSDDDDEDANDEG